MAISTTPLHRNGCHFQSQFHPITTTATSTSSNPTKTSMAYSYRSDSSSVPFFLFGIWAALAPFAWCITTLNASVVVLLCLPVFYCPCGQQHLRGFYPWLMAARTSRWHRFQMQGCICLFYGSQCLVHSLLLPPSSSSVQLFLLLSCHYGQTLFLRCH